VTGPHLADEQLCALLDAAAAGHGAEAAAAPARRHLEDCAGCARRLAALGTVRRVLGTAVPAVPAATRAASIRAVVDGFGAPAAVPPAPPPPPSRTRLRLAVGAVAAAALAAAVVTPLALSHGATSSTTASGARHSAAADRGRAPAPAPVPSTTAPFAPGSSANGGSSSDSSATGALAQSASRGIADLGPSPSLAALAPQLSALAVAPSAAVAAPASTAAGTGATAVTTTPAAPAVTVPAGLLGPFSACLGPAQAAAPGRSVERLATATVDATPALVFLFGPGSTSAALAVAVAQQGCAPLGTATVG